MSMFQVSFSQSNIDRVFFVSESLSISVLLTDVIFNPKKSYHISLYGHDFHAINVGIAKSTGERLGTLLTLAVHWTSPQASDICDKNVCHYCSARGLTFSFVQ